MTTRFIITEISHRYVNYSSSSASNILALTGWISTSRWVISAVATRPNISMDYHKGEFGQLKVSLCKYAGFEDICDASDGAHLWKETQQLKTKINFEFECVFWSRENSTSTNNYFVNMSKKFHFSWYKKKHSNCGCCRYWFDGNFFFTLIMWFNIHWVNLMRDTLRKVNNFPRIHPK